MIDKQVIITNSHSQYHYCGGKIVDESKGGIKVKMNGIDKEIWFFKHEVGEVVGYSNYKEGF